MPLIIRFLLAAGSALLWQLALRPQPTPLLMQLWLLGCVVLPVFRQRHMRRLLTVWLLCGVLGQLWLLLIIPYSSYIIWLGLFRAGLASGAISFSLIHLPLCLSGLTLSGYRNRHSLEMMALYVAGNSLVVFLLFGRPLVLIAACTAFLLYGLIVTVKIRAPAPAIGPIPKPLWSWRGLRNLGLAILISFGLSLAFNSPHEATGSLLVDRFFSRAVRAGTRLLLPNFPLLYGNDGFRQGQGFNETSQGGTIVLSPRPILRLDAPAGRVFYLRTRVYRDYNGLRWLAPILRPSTRPIIESGISDWPPLNDNRSLELTVLDDFLPYLPHTLDSFQISISQAFAESGIAGSLDSGYSLAIPLARESRVLLVTQRSSAGEATDVNSPEQYLAVPDNLAQKMQELAAALMAGPGQADAQNLSERLVQHFSNGYAYTLQPEDDIDDTYFITNFLFETKEGYCVHYASAAVLLARLCGIPARYVTGYLAIMPSEAQQDYLPPPDSRSVVILSGLNSHAWAEFWLPGLGWTSQEFTPAIRALTANRAGGDTGAVSNDPWTRQQLASLADNTGDSKIDTFPASRSGLFLIGALVVTLPLLYLRWRRKPNARASNSRYQAGSNRDPVRPLARRLVRQGLRLGVPDPRSIGWLSWEQALQPILEYNGSQLAADTPALLRRHFFSTEALSKSERQALRKLERALKGCR